MQDVKLRRNDDNMYDILLEGDQFASAPGLGTAIATSIGTDARANAIDTPEAFRRRSWVGNILTIDTPFELGSILWSLVSRNTQRNLNKAVDATRQCLSWMIEQEVATNIEISVEQVDSRRAKVTIDLFKAFNETESYTTLWFNTETVR